MPHEQGLGDSGDPIGVMHAQPRQESAELSGLPGFRPRDGRLQ